MLTADRLLMNCIVKTLKTSRKARKALLVLLLDPAMSAYGNSQCAAVM